MRAMARLLPVALLSCGTAEPIPVSDVVAGITLRGGAFATRDDHLVDFVVHKQHVYVANSNHGVAAMRIDAEGGLTLTDEGSPDEEKVRCTTVALHAPTDTLYCSADEPLDQDILTVRLFEVSTPGQLVERESLELLEQSVRDLEVVGDRLLIHHFHDGLWTADIDSTGALTG